jgi:dienelactone hydrolase
LNKPGIFTPENTIVLHPYGRYCNAMKFAGEVDTFEAMDSVKSFYPIDEDRICMRGFSMGGAASWHLGAHYADQWAAVNPGAGFVDVEIYQGLTDKLDSIPWYEKKMWSLYDPLAVAVNLTNTTLIAYSGEDDKQKQAADLMEAALAKEGHKMEHIIGPKTGHKYEPKAKDKVGQLVNKAAQNGKSQQPSKVRFATSSLKYNQMHWITLDGLEKHWEMARVEGEMKEDGIHLHTSNLSAMSLDLKGIHGTQRTIYIDGQKLAPVPSSASEHWTPHLHKSEGKWTFGDLPKELRKKHNLQGPIDDAFMAPFLVVTPSGKSLNPAFDQWVEREIQEFVFQWRKQFRGEPRMKKDTEVTPEDVKNYNLILFGNIKSNEKLSDMIYKLPFRWKKTHFEVNGKEYSFDTHVPALIYPNPENPDRYIVINSGFTFAAAGKDSNSRQTPRLPDWAVLEQKVAPLDRADGTGVVDAGFFDENWK